MTREEASFILANIDRRVCDDELNEALDVAIEALEQKPCDDAISRQAVYDLMRSLTRWCVRSEDGKFNNVGLLYDDVMFGIYKLPSINPQELAVAEIKLQKIRFIIEDKTTASNYKVEQIKGVLDEER